MKIIILDDSPTVQMILESLLEDLGVDEDEMHLFEDGHEALNFIKDSGADIIFSDVNMPKMHGSEFVKKVLAFNPLLVSSLFVISADNEIVDLKKMKKSGAHRYIKKPIDSHLFSHFIVPELLKIRAREALDDRIN